MRLTRCGSGGITFYVKARFIRYTGSVISAAENTNFIENKMIKNTYQLYS